MFDKVLVANRGEIAVRVMRTLRHLGIRSIAVYSEADTGSRHVDEADEAYCIGPALARDSYLNIERILDAALRSGAQAVHPGYGFLSERAEFAEACADDGVVFIGPPASAIRAMGDKIRSKQLVKASGVPVVPGLDEPGLSDEQLREASLRIGLPVLLKPSAGGGGKGMHLVEREVDLPAAITRARREAAAYFGDDTVFVERFVHNPRHIEIQVLADSFGNAVHLGERECSLQRRHQKIIEEAPSPLLDPATRAEMGRQAIAAALGCGYVNAGTVEFIVSADDPTSFFFMEMNTRLQVEHPVTEMVYGLDLVECQLRIAVGEALHFRQDELVPLGHAVEARVYAEDPGKGFLPTGGHLYSVRDPQGQGIRVDSGVSSGRAVVSDYDPMIAKVIAFGADRAEALRRLDGALADTETIGVASNVAFLRRLIRHPDVRAGRLDTGLVDRTVDELAPPAPADRALVVAALWAAQCVSLGGGPWTQLTCWRHGRRAPIVSDFDVDGRRHHVEVVAPHGVGREWAVVLDDHPLIAARLTRVDQSAPDGVIRLGVALDELRFTASLLDRPPSCHVVIDGEAWELRRHDRLPRGTADSAVGSGDGVVRSPMPGLHEVAEIF